MSLITEEDIKFTKKVSSLERHTTTGIVSSVSWKYIAEYETHIVERNESTLLPPPEPGNTIIDYGDLDNETVIGWVVSVIGEERVSYMKSRLVEAINVKVSPPMVKEPPPWIKAEPVV